MIKKSDRMGWFTKKKDGGGKSGRGKDGAKGAPKAAREAARQDTKAPARRKVWGIKEKTLRMILEASKDSYPKEFAGLLRAEGGIITELILLPGTLSGDDSALFQLHMRPIDLSIIGTVHSHPSGAVWPSEADLSLFGHYGHTHIIVGRPYTMKSWRAFDTSGEEITLEVVSAPGKGKKLNIRIE